MRSTILTPALLTLSLVAATASCGGGSADPVGLTESGNSALGSSDWDGALGDFEAALAALGDDTSHESYVTASLGAVEARMHSDADAAKDEFLALTGRVSLPDRDFSYIGGKFANAGEYEQAAYVLDAGIKAHPESQGLQALKQNILEVAASDASLANVMASLGYL